MDSWLASELSSPKTLKQCPDLEQDVQAYIELCARSFVAPKGRRIIAIVSRYFDLDRMRGSGITASTLFQIELHGNSVQDLRDFTQRIRLVLGAVPVAQRPDARLTGEWLFHRVKHLRKLERYIEAIRESSSGSSRRDFYFLRGKIQDVLAQDREDANVRSMLGYLAPSTKNPPMQSLLPRSLRQSLLLIPRVWLLRQRRRKPRPLGFLLRSFRRGPSPKRTRRLSRSQMRRRPRSRASSLYAQRLYAGEQLQV